MFRNKSISPDNEWIAYYKFYKKENNWIANVEVYSKSVNYNNTPVVMVQYVLPESDIKTRDAKFEWKSLDEESIDHLRVLFYSGIGGDEIRIVEIDIRKRTISMEINPNTGQLDE